MKERVLDTSGKRSVLKHLLWDELLRHDPGTFYSEILAGLSSVMEKNERKFLEILENPNLIAANQN